MNGGGSGGAGGLSSEEVARLQAESVQFKKQLAHLTTLLNESEANVDRLMEETKLLKSEMRRQERNDRRDSGASPATNFEYLKNVVLKFLEFSEEREKLVPVISTLLQFSPEELQRARHAVSEAQPAVGKNDSWSSYVYRWA
eukprot:m.140265 g.140265  ORF g.140265 m.140265 type:complete len:142 (-) comp16666_c9_seq2:1527-1952(-)